MKKKLILILGVIFLLLELTPTVSHAIVITEPKITQAAITYIEPRSTAWCDDPYYARRHPRLCGNVIIEKKYVVPEYVEPDVEYVEPGVGVGVDLGPFSFGLGVGATHRHWRHHHHY